MSRATYVYAPEAPDQNIVQADVISSPPSPISDSQAHRAVCQSSQRLAQHLLSPSVRSEVPQNSDPRTYACARLRSSRREKIASCPPTLLSVGDFAGLCLHITGHVHVRRLVTRLFGTSLPCVPSWSVQDKRDPLGVG